MNAVTALPAIPDATSAPLPVVYEAAQKALAECFKVDECKAWTDHFAAVASYARQAKDESLRNLAVRIQARATRRLNELLKVYPELRGGDRKTDQVAPTHNLNSKPPAGDGADQVARGDNLISRRQAAHEAGLSDWQYRNVRAVGSVSESEFEAALESPHPPSVAQLAARGVASHPQPTRPQVYVPDDIKPAPIEHAMRAQTRLREFAAFCGTTEPSAVARACTTLDIDAIRGYVETIDAWLDRFIVALPAGADEADGF